MVHNRNNKNDERLMISVVIPNYNKSRFLLECLESVVAQNYPYIEIVVVDDGSTDDSVDIVNDYVVEHPEANIKLIKQKNLGATVARNKGIDNSNGKYAIFLDSDDLLSPRLFNKIVPILRKNSPDMLVGSYLQIDENGKKLNRRSFAKDETTFRFDKDFMWLIDIDPLPSNKIYNLDLIKQNSLYWDNVKIAQDLDFYLKYVALCHNVIIVNGNVSKYRITSGSISRTYDFRIFDIKTVFANVKKFYIERGLLSYYEKYMPIQILKHYNFQLSKQIFYKRRLDRRKIIDFFSNAEKEIDYADSVPGYKRMRKTILRKNALKFFITSSLYCFFVRTMTVVKNIIKHAVGFLNEEY